MRIEADMAGNGMEDGENNRDEMQREDTLKKDTVGG